MSNHSLLCLCLQFFIGLMCIVFMYCILIIYAECCGFMVEAFIMTLMGAVVNAGTAANYIMVGFWAITYCITCYNDCYKRYLALNQKVFEYIKNKLGERIKYLTTLREDKQRYTGFKYFSRADLEGEVRVEIDNEFESENEVNAVLGRSPVRQTSQVFNTYEDSIEYINGKLHWKINHLVLFVDKKDVPRIPRELYDQICHIEAPGCPGPVYRGLLKATQKLLYMILFLVFVAIVVISFGNLYNVSATNQLLVTLAGGFVPFVIRFVLTPNQTSADLNTYTFEGKVHDILKNFSQIWPVHDLTFTLDSNVEQDIPGDRFPSPPPPPPPPGGGSDMGHGYGASGATGGGGGGGGWGSGVGGGGGGGRGGGGGGSDYPPYPDRKQPTNRKVDLMITIRDEGPLDDPTANLRSEHGSLGSVVSGHRMVHDVAYSPVRQPTRLMSHPLGGAAAAVGSSRVGGEASGGRPTPPEDIPLRSLNRNVSGPINMLHINPPVVSQPSPGSTSAPVQRGCAEVILEADDDGAYQYLDDDEQPPPEPRSPSSVHAEMLDSSQAPLITPIARRSPPPELPSGSPPHCPPPPPPSLPLESPPMLRARLPEGAAEKSTRFQLPPPRSGSKSPPPLTHARTTRNSSRSPESRAQSLERACSKSPATTPKSSARSSRNTSKSSSVNARSRTTSRDGSKSPESRSLSARGRSKSPAAASKSANSSRHSSRSSAGSKLPPVIKPVTSPPEQRGRTRAPVSPKGKAKASKKDAMNIEEIAKML